MKRLKIFQFIIVLLVILTGCSDGQENNTAGAGTEEGKAPVASVENVITDISTYGYRNLGDVLYYVEAVQKKDAARPDWRVLRKERGADAEEIAYFAFPEQYLLSFAVGETGDVYYLYCDEGNGYGIYLRRDGAEGDCIYDVQVQEPCLPVEGQTESGIPEEALKWYGMRDGQAGEDGRVCFYSAYDLLYVFDEKGALIQTRDTAAGEAYTDCGTVNAGKLGIYLYRAGENAVTLHKVDMQSGELDQGTDVVFDQSCSYVSVFSGFEHGILIVMEDKLKVCDPRTGELEQLLDWSSPEVSLSGRDVLLVGLTDGEGICALVKEGDSFRQVMVEEQDSVPERKTVTFGGFRLPTEGMSFLNELVKGFNQSNTEYKVEIIEYDSADMFDVFNEIMKGEWPDLFELSGSFLPTDILIEKGVLEDLYPYLENSSKVSKEDILPGVLAAQEYNGKLACIYPAFYIQALIVEEGHTQNWGWSQEDFLDMAELHPDIRLSEYGMGRTSLLEFCLMADVDRYINWEKKECYFQNDSFIQLLTRIKDLRLKEEKPDPSDKGTFLDRDYLMEDYVIIDTSYYVDARTALKGVGEITGYPNHEKEPYFMIGGNSRIAMNSRSDCKEGAWAFLEYLLSEEYQEQNYTFSYSQFPVRKDAFEQKMNSNQDIKADRRTNSFTYEIMSSEEFPEITEEDREAIRFMVEHLHQNNSAVYNSEYMSIIHEEAGAFFAGDKTAEGAAANIQNRVMLFLNE